MSAADAVPSPGEPTEHPPGSAGKLAVLAARAARGEPLFHSLDAAGPGPATGPRGPTAGRDAAGVTRHGRRWKVRVTVKGRGQVYVGLYVTREEAERAAKQARGGAV